MSDLSNYTSVFRVRLGKDQQQQRGNSATGSNNSTAGGGLTTFGWIGQAPSGLPSQQQQQVRIQQVPQVQQQQQVLHQLQFQNQIQNQIPNQIPTQDQPRPTEARRPPARGKPRPVVSCHLCRARKQKCDRRLPCSTCVRRGDGDLCRYGDAGGGPSSSTSASTTTRSISTHRRASNNSTAAAGRQEAQIRLQRLEELVNQMVSRPTGETSSGKQVGGPGGSAVGGTSMATTGASVTTTGTGPQAPPMTSQVASRPAKGTHEWLLAYEPTPQAGNNSNQPGGVRQVSGQMPFAGATNWAEVLDSIRDIQTFLSGGGGAGMGEPGSGHGEEVVVVEEDEDEEGADDGGGGERDGDGDPDDDAIVEPSTGTLYPSPNTTTASPSGVPPMAPDEQAEPDIIFATAQAPRRGPRTATGQPAPMQTVVAHLPSRSECDRLVAVYFQSRFITSAFLHSGKFQRDYGRFWATGNPASAHATSPLLWMSMLASILCIGATISGAQQQTWLPEEEISRNRIDIDGKDDSNNNNINDNKDLRLAARMRRLSTRCLLSGEYMTARPLSVEALLLNAHTRLVQKRDADPALGAAFGVAARLAQRMGYHQVDSTRAQRTVQSGQRGQQVLTPFEREMRRRAWFMVEAFDMLYSFQYGMPTIVHEDETRTNPPTNLRDDDFDEWDLVLPPARALTDPSSGSALFYSTKLRLIRQLRRIFRYSVGGGGGGGGDNNGKDDIQKTEELAHDLNAVLATVPPMMRMPVHIRDCPFTDVSHDIMHRLVVDMLYHKAICVLYRHALGSSQQQQQQPNPVLAKQRRLCLMSALRILDLHAEFEVETRLPPIGQKDQKDPKDQTEQGTGAGRLATDRHVISSLALHDFLLAATILCLDLIERRGGGEDENCPVSETTLPVNDTVLPVSDTPPGLPPTYEPSLAPRAVDRSAKLAALRHAYALWHGRRVTSRDAAHASRILGAIVKKLSEMEEAIVTAAASVNVYANVPAHAIPTSGTLPFDSGFSYGTSLQDPMAMPDLNVAYDWATQVRLMLSSTILTM